jgi:glutamyl-tRNA synthetase
MHVGGVRTALFAWLVARQNNGQFILRIEDTDKSREVPKAEKHIIESLQWIGINWDEGPDKGGEYSPYRQSERLSIYLQWGKKLIETGRAYADPYSPEELEAFRQQAKDAKKPFLYRNHRPKSRPEWDGSIPLRFKSEPKNYNWHDEVLGDLRAGPEVIDDFILIKSDGYPTYNFCHIIDDHLMKISHVIRSQEFIASVPKFLNLHEALGIKPPIMATLPYVMSMDGKKKLSKRDGVKDILDYKREGYLPEAMLNFLVSLGWNDGTEKEIFSEKELVNKFSLSRVQKSGAKFDKQRLLWMNGHYIRAKKLDELFGLTNNYWPPEADGFDDKYKKQVLATIQERLKYLSEIPSLSRFFFKTPQPDTSLISSNKQIKNIPKNEIVELLKASYKILGSNSFDKNNLTNTLNELLVSTNQKPAVLFSIIRIAVTWAPYSPALSDTLFVLGKDETLNRLSKSIDFLS